MYHLFAVTAPGMEAFTRQELALLNMQTAPPNAPSLAAESPSEAGGVSFTASLAELYQANLHLRTPNRILARMGMFFYATSFPELHHKASRLPWEQTLRPGQPVAIRVTCRQSRLYHSDAVAERVAGAIADRFGQPSPLVKFTEDDPAAAQLIIVRLVNDRCTVSVDTSGALLHRRAYRLETAKAPLRETLAAGLLMASGWNSAAALLDPFCGSGTIPIEAAMLSRRIAPGKNRRFAFMDWQNFDPRLWQTLLDKAGENEQAAAAPIFASDRDAGAIRIAQSNAARAGVLESIQFSCRAFSAIEPPSTAGWVVTNPPYGVRFKSSHDPRNLYSHLGDVLRSLCPHWKVGLLCESEYLAGHTHLNFEESLPLVNGGIAVKFFKGSVD